VDADPLIRRFASAHLGARVFAPALDAVFQMAISDGRAPRFDLWPGGPGNRVEVQGTDPRLRQLVLFVQEQPRAFRERVSKRSLDNGTIRVDWNLVRRVTEDERWVTVELVTSARKRHFLCGMDERDAFIAQLPRAVSTVREAHAALRTPSLKREEVVARQGEWFFVRPRPVEARELEEALDRGRTFISRGRSIAEAVFGMRGGGKPHLANELVVYLRREPGLASPRRVFVRGRIRHLDHAPVDFKSWRRVVRNAEVVEAGVARMDGIRWVD
jgi:hypothetical protein